MSPRDAPWSRLWADRPGRVVGGLLTVAVPAIIYLASLYPGVGGRVNPGDSIKFQYVGSILGVPHEPGYPQYVVLSYLWGALPWPFEAALQINLLSAFCALVAGGFLWHALRRLTERPMVATLGTWTLLLSRSVWVFATEAEVHALQLIWVCGCFWLVVRWTEDHDRRWLIALLAGVAFSFGNHPLAVTLLLGVGALVLFVEPAAMRSPRNVAAGVGLALLGMSQYGFLLLRSWQGAPYLEAVPPRASLHELWQGMVGSRFVERLWFKDGLAGLQEGWSALVEASVLELSLPVLLLAIFGVAVALRRRSQAAVFLLAMLAGSVVFVLCYRAPDPEPYFAYAWMPVAVLAALGAAALPRRVRLAACTVWLAILGWHLVRDLPTLRVPESKFDRSSLVVRAPAHSRVLLEQVGHHDYPTEQLANYYTYAFAGTPPDVVVSLGETALQDAAYLDPRPLVLAAPEIQRRLQEFGVSFRSLGARDDRGRRILVTQFAPTESLLLERSAAGLEIWRDGAEPLVSAAPGIHAVILDPRQPGLRAVVAIPWRSTPSAERRIWEILDAMWPGDTLCLVIQGRVERVELMLDRLLTVRAKPRGETHSVVLLANLSVDPHWLRVLANPETQRLAVEAWTRKEPRDAG